MGFLTTLFGIIGLAVAAISLLAIGVIFLRRPAPKVRLTRDEAGFIGSDQETTTREKDRNGVLVRTQAQNAARGRRHFFLTRRGQLAPATVRKNGNGYNVQMRDYSGRGIGPTFSRSANQIFLK